MNKSNRRRLTCLIICGALAASVGLAASAQEETAEKSGQKSAEKSGTDESIVIEVTQEPTTALERLALEVVRLTDQVTGLRHELARAHLEAESAERELADLRQFIADHREFGDDFARYQAMRDLAEREAADQRRAAAKAQRDAERAARSARRQEILAQRASRNAAEDHERRYERAGFSSLGFDVYGGRMAFYYREKEDPETRVDFDPWFGLYYRTGGVTSEIDYSAMNISGSILNAADEVRNIGVAITFFDENGNQVGSEIVKISNARPDVPYPFNATIDMALNRAFSSSSTYVLYADPVTTTAAP